MFQSCDWEGLAGAVASCPELAPTLRPILQLSVDWTEKAHREAKHLQDQAQAHFLEVQSQLKQAKGTATISSVEPQLEILRSRMLKKRREAKGVLDDAQLAARRTRRLMEAILSGDVNEAKTCLNS